MSERITLDHTLITPQLAAKMISVGENYRRIRDRRVAIYADAMRRGVWQEFGPPVIVSSCGIVLDGWHRLSAVVQSGCSVKMPVITGYPKSASRAFDDNLGRRVCDVLRAESGVDTRLVTVAAILRICRMGFNIRSDDVVLNSDQPEVYARWKKNIDFTLECFPSARRGLPAPVMAAWARAYDFYPTRRDELRLAASLLYSLEFGANDSAMRCLFKFLHQPHSSIGGGSIQKIIYGKSTRAIQAWMRGESIKILTMPRDEIF